MSDLQNDELWRDVIRKTGESLTRDAFDPKCDPETLIRRTAQAFLLVKEDIDTAEQRRLRLTT